MSRPRRILTMLTLASALCLLAAGAAPAASARGTFRPPHRLPQLRPTVRQALHHGVTPPLRDLKPAPPRGASGTRFLGRLPRSGRRGAGPGADPVRQRSLGPGTMPPPNLTFDGVQNDDNFPLLVLPSDDNGDVGPNHYVQWVNLSIEMFDKGGHLLVGPIPGNSLFGPATPNCAAENQGDPIAQYDQLADRWMLSQFAFPDFVSGPFYQCIAVSQTGDPTGAYFTYEFLISTTKLNDYPHFGVWPDAYYMSINQFVGAAVFTGPGAVAFERDAMLLGDPGARMVYFDIQDSNFGGQLPSDLDGTTLPPAGSPNYFVEADDDSNPVFPTDRLDVFKFHVDWSNPANSTFTGPTAIPTAPFDSNMCNFDRNCIPQPSPGFALDAISDRIMYRLGYRNFGDHESLMVNHTVDVDGADHAGIRWYEVRGIGTTPTIHQQGTYAPDAQHRWMGSIAMDKAGDVALGFSLSSSTRFPTIAYTGRLAGDPLGQMGQGEAILYPGGGAQTDDSGRWGDYTALTVDPNGCTFWYTNQYYPFTDGALWHTRIGSFTFPGCLGSGADLSLTMSSSPEPVVVGSDLTYTLNAANNGPDAGTGATVTDTLPAGTSLVSASSSQGTCSGTATVTCSLGGMASGSTATVTIKVKAPATPGTIVNSATISGPSNDPNPANNSASAASNVVQPCSTPGVLVSRDTSDVAPNVPPVPEVDIKDLYAAEPYQADGVSRLVFTLTLGTTGTGQLPPTSQWYILWNRPNPDADFDRNYVAMKTDGAGTPSFEYGKISPPSVNLPTRFGDVDAGSYDLASRRVQISIATSKVDGVGAGSVLGALQARTFYQRADGGPVTQLQSSDFGPAGSYTMVGNSACGPDLSVTMTDSPDPVNVGSNLTYHATVTNGGPATTPATGITLTDPLPSAVSFVSATPSQGSCSGGSTVTCSLGSLAHGAIATVDIVAKATTPGTATNTATVSGSESDPNAGNNSATATTTINPAADLSVTNTDSPDPVHVGQNLTYTVKVTNNGPSDSAGVSLTDQLAKSAGFGSASTTQGTCTLKPSKNMVTCSLGTIAGGSTVTVTIVVKPSSKGTITATASASGSTFDPNTANNSAQAMTKVLP